MAQAGVVRARHRILVLNEDGRPAAQAVVTVLRSTVPFPEIALLTDDAGSVLLQLPPGAFTFRVRAGADAVGEVEVVSPGAEESVVRLTR